MFNLKFYELLQKSCKPGIWSKGVSIARTGGVLEDSKKAGEFSFRVNTPDTPIANSVTLWPDDEDWYCDCEDRNEVCAHVAATLIAWKGDLFQKKKSPMLRVEYRFFRSNGRIRLERWIDNQRLTRTLVSHVGGIQSGRVQSPPVSVNQDDLAIDAAWVGTPNGDLDRATLIRILKLMGSVSLVSLDSKPVTIQAQSIVLKGGVTDEAEGYRLKVIRDGSVLESFANGAALCAGDVLRPIEAPLLSEEERGLLAGAGRFFAKSDEHTLVVKVIPLLEKKIPIEILSKKLPVLVRVIPEVQFEMKQEGEKLTVIPRLGAPKNQATKNSFLAFEAAEEKKLIQQLKAELQLLPGQQVHFQGHEAAQFLLKYQKTDWFKSKRDSGDLQGAPQVYESLDPKLEATADGMQVHFGVDGKTADPKKVFQAWRENAQFVPLLEGGWAPLPNNWLDRFGERIQQLVHAKEAQKRLPTYLAPQMIDLFEENGQEFPDVLNKLRERLTSTTGTGLTLPSDLKATLRHYQEQGVQWLHMLRDAEVGAMLADDMGLGKTLQSMCAIQGKTLIVAPTSVLHGWVEQLKKFRPTLKVSVYAGPQRKLDINGSDVILTSYAILRLDREALAIPLWDTVVLDESQLIKNPDSQMARAAQKLNGKFKMALSGTPIENKPDDLWSQFQFLNPGLLGSRDSFQDLFSSPVLKGDQNAADALKKRIQPFFLRRLKKEVAPELPPKTETVLYCELSQDERNLYDAVLNSTRKEVLEKLEEGGGVIAALEMLLRLRQTCCHAGLVPGQIAESSSKVELLIETLLESIGLGHRALVFSQWTSYLDLIEPHLKANKIRFNRLDGSTDDRQGVVNEFQKPDGPSVMLLSLKAGGVGINLTAADHVFLMDPWWNPTVENQAIDRSHRIGQTQPILVHRLVAENTIESQILELQAAKLAMAGSVLEGTGVAAPNREELLRLLSL